VLGGHLTFQQHQFRASAKFQGIHDLITCMERNNIPQTLGELEKSVKQIVVVTSIEIAS
jgi:hypothetical protein